MRSLSFLAVTLAVLQLTSAISWGFGSRTETDDYTRPNFCGEAECPKYKVIKKFNGYELREYMPSVYASAKIDKMSVDFWEHHEFTEGANVKLQYYFLGVNNQNQTMNMTVPLLKMHTKNEVHMRYMIPQNYSRNPPTPNDPTVEIKAMPRIQCYVRTFGGWATSENMRFISILLGYRHVPSELGQLRMDLARDGERYTIDSGFYTAEYNDASDYFGRHNEVLIMKR